MSLSLVKKIIPVKKGDEEKSYNNGVIAGIFITGAALVAAYFIYTKYQAHIAKVAGSAVQIAPAAPILAPAPIVGPVAPIPPVSVI